MTPDQVGLPTADRPMTGRDEQPDQGEQAVAAEPAAKPTRRGRPLEADRTPAILDAVNELLLSSGYDRLRVQDVAERAGVGLGTIYRRWPTKQALVIAAMECGRGVDQKFVSTGDPRADLVATFTKMATSMSGTDSDVIGFMASLRSEPEVADSFRCTSLKAIRGRLREMLAAARGTGIDAPELDLLVDIGPGILMFRAAIAGETCDAESLAEAVTELLLSYEPRA